MFLFRIYYTTVKLGTPPKEFEVVVDTGSDLLWINCPRSSDTKFDISGSTTARIVPCSDPGCSSDRKSECKVNQCSYTMVYGDGSGTAGFYIYDVVNFDMIAEQSMTSNLSSIVMFGCSTLPNEELNNSVKPLDGIFGLGPGALSVRSQLSSKKATPDVFSHCLKGDGSGGGTLVFGEIEAPNIAYTPLVPSLPHYYVNLESIAVDGKLVSIDSDVFATSKEQGTVVDSGTTLALLVEEAYDPLINTITTTVSGFAKPIIYGGKQCYQVSNRLSDMFPSISLNFKEGASMNLEPKQYLIFQGVDLWCLGFHKAYKRITILGDLVLRDKIVIYDLVNQRIGWVNYDCSSSVNVSLNTSKINAGQLSVTSSQIVFIAALLMHITVLLVLER